MIKLTVIIAETEGGVNCRQGGVNCRQDGAPASQVESFWLSLIGNAIKEAMLAGRDALAASGIAENFETRTGEAARIAGEQRHGIPGEAGGN